VASTLPRVLHLNRRDNVAVAIRALRRGEEVELAGRTLAAAQDIPFGHKVAVVGIAAGDSVVKYGEVIGRATSAIAPGHHVHVHNVVSARLPGGS
jgi:altronate dehydratase